MPKIRVPEQINNNGKANLFNRFRRQNQKRRERAGKLRGGASVQFRLSKRDVREVILTRTKRGRYSPLISYDVGSGYQVWNTNSIDIFPNSIYHRACCIEAVSCAFGEMVVRPSTFMRWYRGTYRDNTHTTFSTDINLSVLMTFMRMRGLPFLLRKTNISLKNLLLETDGVYVCLMELPNKDNHFIVIDSRRSIVLDGQSISPLMYHRSMNHKKFLKLIKCNRFLAARQCFKRY